jgi:hypothetical protein
MLQNIIANVASNTNVRVRNDVDETKKKKKTFENKSIYHLEKITQ